MTKFKGGELVRFKNSEDKHIYRVYAVYDKNHVSLGLREYPDTEMDYQVNTNELKIVKA